MDILMITYQSPERTRISLGRLLDIARDSTKVSMRVWLWQNGSDPATLEVVRSFADHPSIERFHHSEENVRLRPPTNWMFEHGTGSYVSKIDDDAVLPIGWPGPLIAAHEDEPRFGVLGSWRFMEEDFDSQVASSKIQSFSGGHRIMRNLWVEGSSYVMKRACVEEVGLLRPDQGFTSYCRGVGRRGWVNGYYYPFVRYQNLDDPRDPESLIRTDAELATRLPLSAKQNGVSTVAEWTDQIRRSAQIVQTAPYDPKYYSGWRQQWRRGRRFGRRLRGERRGW